MGAAVSYSSILVMAHLRSLFFERMVLSVEFEIGSFFFSFSKSKASVYSTLTSLFVLGVLDVSIDVSQFYIPSLYLSIFLSIFCCHFPF